MAKMLGKVLAPLAAMDPRENDMHGHPSDSIGI
jgi:hypothetical protein